VVALLLAPSADFPVTKSSQVASSLEVVCRRLRAWRVPAQLVVIDRFSFDSSIARGGAGVDNETLNVHLPVKSVCWTCAERQHFGVTLVEWCLSVSLEHLQTLTTNRVGPGAL